VIRDERIKIGSLYGCYCHEKWIYGPFGIYLRLQTGQIAYYATERCLTQHPLVACSSARPVTRTCWRRHHIDNGEVVGFQQITEQWSSFVCGSGRICLILLFALSVSTVTESYGACRNKTNGAMQHYETQILEHRGNRNRHLFTNISATLVFTGLSVLSILFLWHNQADLLIFTLLILRMLAQKGGKNGVSRKGSLFCKTLKSINSGNVSYHSVQNV
jgi:hypothetical protein